MRLQTIKSADGKDEYVLLPVAVYRALKGEIEDKLAHRSPQRKAADEYVPFVLEDYVDNPVALARMKAHLTQQELAERLQSVQERLGSESFHTHAADLTIDLTQIQAAVGTCAAAMQGAQAASLHAAKEALERLPDWQLLEKPQQLEYFGRIEALELSPTANLDGIKSLLNQQYTLGQTLGQVEKLVAAEGEQKRIERLQAERERLLHEGKTKLQRRVDVPARITERGELDTLITTLNSVAAEISVYADIEITLTVKD